MGAGFCQISHTLWNVEPVIAQAEFRSNPGEFRLPISGTAGLAFVIEVCVDLEAPVWKVAATGVLPNGPSPFMAALVAESSRGFYRIRSP